MIDINDGRDAFLNADEIGLKDAEYTNGQSIIVQVSQEQRAEKGAKVMRGLQFVGTYLVYCPYRMNVEASARIAQPERLRELRHLVIENTVGQEGWIIRTAAADAEPDEITDEMVELRKMYDAVRAKARIEAAPCLLYAKANPLLNIWRQIQ